MSHAHCRTRLSWHFATAFERGHFQAGGSRAGTGNGTRSEHSPEEGGHQGGPSSRQRVRVLEPYFIVPGKDGGGLRPILDLSQLNRSVIRLKFNSIQDDLYSAFHDTIVAKQLYRKLSFYNRLI